MTDGGVGAGLVLDQDPVGAAPDESTAQVPDATASTAANAVVR